MFRKARLKDSEKPKMHIGDWQGGDGGIND